MANKLLLLAGVALLGGCGDARTLATTSTCPAGVQPTLSSIDQKLFKVTCTACHAGGLVASSGGLDLSGNAYATLVNVPAENLSATAGPPGLLRVKPGDPDGSMLYHKVTLGPTPSPQYGSGMPLNAPGSICPEVQDAIRAWIANGAPND